ncbi:MAG: micrococcal nuclease [Firmicutes bacterium]|nr:micrococcal nuclease [Bacillota bacterium]
MRQLEKSYLQLFILFCFAVSLATIFPSITLSHQPIISNQITYLDDCAADNFAPQSKTAYVGNSYIRIFHHARCQYTRLISDKHRIYFNTREEAVRSMYGACKVCRP